MTQEDLQGDLYRLGLEGDGVEHNDGVEGSRGDGASYYPH